MKKTLLLLLICLTMAWTTLQANSSFWGWSLLESPQFFLYYPAGKDTLAYQLLETLETDKTYVHRFIGHNPGKTVIILEDQGLNINGLALPLPEKMILWQHAPLSDGFVTQYKNWHRLVGIHEYAHIAHLTYAEKELKAAAFAFGNIFSPHLFTPAWMKEGLAVNVESAQSTHEGRLNDARQNAIVDAALHHHTLPDLSYLDYPFFKFPMGERTYIGGARFLDYVRTTYGDADFRRFLKHYAGNSYGLGAGMLFPGLGIDASARAVFGKDFPALYQDWQRSAPEPTLFIPETNRQLTTTGWTKQSLISHKGHLYYYQDTLTHPSPFTYHNRRAIMEYDPATDTERVIIRLPSPLAVPLHIANDTLYYGIYDATPGYTNLSASGYGLKTILYSFHLPTAARRFIIKDHITAFTVSGNDLLYTTPRPTEFGSYIHRLDNTGVHKIAETPLLISEIKPYGDTLITVAKTSDTTWNIYRLPLANPAATANALFHTPWAITNMDINGDTLYFTVNEPHRRTINRHHLQTGSTEQLTDSGVIRKGVPFNNTLFIIGMNQNGEDLYHSPHITPHTPEWLEKTTAVPRAASSTANIHPENAILTNTQSLAWPYLRLIPLLTFFGEDHLRLLEYNLSYSSRQGLYYSVTSHHLSPLDLAVSRTLDGIFYSARIPVFRSSQYGLSATDLYASTDFHGEERLGSTLQFRIPDNRTDISIEANPSTSLLFALFRHRFMIGTSQWMISAFSFKDPSREYVITPPTGFYGNTSDGKWIRASYNFKLASAHWAFRPINIAIGDIFTGFFGEYATFDEKNPWRYGTEFRLEFMAANELHFNTLILLPFAGESIRIGINLDF